MPSKKSQSEAITKEFLTEQLQTFKTDTKEFLTEQLQTFKLDILKHVDAKIEDSRQDAKEQLQSVAAGLNKKIDDVEKSLRQEIHYTQLAIKEVKNDTIRIEKRLLQAEKNLSEKIEPIVEKLDHHDEEIVFLKAAIVK